jgi:AcrR family transcriptional regulator
LQHRDETESAMAGTKERIVSASADLLRRRGYTGTGVKQIVEAAGAPFGSLYHFFPGGKEQLGAEAIRWSGQTWPRTGPGCSRTPKRTAPCAHDARRLRE